MRFVREALPAKWAAVFLLAEDLVVIDSGLSEDDALTARRLMQGRCVKAFVVLLKIELAIAASFLIRVA